MNIGFEKIDPTPTYPSTVSAVKLRGLKWNSQKKVVVDFKVHLKKEFRKIQHGRCCFCRRLLPDDYATQLEHFVDKDQYPQFTFEIKNLALACGTCNSRKNGIFSTIKAKHKKYLKRQGIAIATRCPVLVQELPSGSAFPNNAAAFRWVNPHFDNFSDHISLLKGWVFRSESRKGIRTIRGAGLNDIALIEQRVLKERLDSRAGTLAMLVCAIAEFEYHTAKDLAAALCQEIARRRK